MGFLHIFKKSCICTINLCVCGGGGGGGYIHMVIICGRDMCQVIAGKAFWEGIKIKFQGFVKNLFPFIVEIVAYMLEPFEL